MSSVAMAQSVLPTPVESGSTQTGQLSDDSPRNPADHPFACYALNTQPGEEVSIQLSSSAFDPVLEVARGALCTAASLQYENDNRDSTTTDARLTFRAAGGRYLILVRGASPTARGAYQLHLAGDSMSEQQPVAESDEERRRQQIMAMEIEKRNAEIAAAEARRRAEIAAAEAARVAALEREAESQQRASRGEPVGYAEPPQRNLAEVFASTLTSELEAKQRRDEAFQRSVERAARRGDAEYQRRVAAERAQAQQDQALRKATTEQARAAEAQRLAEERARVASEASRLASASQNTVASTSDQSRSSPSQSRQAALIATPEAIVVCTHPDSDGGFTCDSPVDVNLPGGPKQGATWSTPEKLVAGLDSCSRARRLHSATHLVWGCGYGATNGKNTMDRSAGVDVKGRNTYYCVAREWPCTRTTPQ